MRPRRRRCADRLGLCTSTARLVGGGADGFALACQGRRAVRPAPPSTAPTAPRRRLVADGGGGDPGADRAGGFARLRPARRRRAGRCGRASRSGCPRRRRRRVLRRGRGRGRRLSSPRHGVEPWLAADVRVTDAARARGRGVPRATGCLWIAQLERRRPRTRAGKRHGRRRWPPSWGGQATWSAAATRSVGQRETIRGHGGARRPAPRVNAAFPIRSRVGVRAAAVHGMPLAWVASPRVRLQHLREVRPVTIGLG